MPRLNLTVTIPAAWATLVATPLGDATPRRPFGRLIAADDPTPYRRERRVLTCAASEAQWVDVHLTSDDRAYRMEVVAFAFGRPGDGVPLKAGDTSAELTLPDGLDVRVRFVWAPAPAGEGDAPGGAPADEPEDSPRFRLRFAFITEGAARCFVEGYGLKRAEEDPPASEPAYERRTYRWYVDVGPTADAMGWGPIDPGRIRDGVVTVADYDW